MQRVFSLALFMLLIGFAPAAMAQRSIDEAVEQLANELSSQIGEQRISSITILQFTNLSGGQTARERNIADKLARSISEKSGLRLISRVRAEAVVLQLGMPLGSEFYGPTAARIGKGLGADAVITGSIESHGGGSIQLRAQAFSSQAGINIASAQSQATESVQVKPRVVVRPAPRVQLQPESRPDPGPTSSGDISPTHSAPPHDPTFHIVQIKEDGPMLLVTVEIAVPEGGKREKFAVNAEDSVLLEEDGTSRPLTLKIHQGRSVTVGWAGFRGIGPEVNVGTHVRMTVGFRGTNREISTIQMVKVSFGKHGYVRQNNVSIPFHGK